MQDLLNIYAGVFCEKKLELKAISYFRKKTSLFMFESVLNIFMFVTPISTYIPNDTIPLHSPSRHLPVQS